MDRLLSLLGLVLILGAVSVDSVLGAECVNKAQGTKTSTKHQTKELMELGYILAGKEIAVEYFKDLDLPTARKVRFVSTSAATDLNYVDRIHNPCNFEVERTVYDFSGRVATTEIIALPEAEFFARLKYVKNYVEKNGSLPTKVESWQVKTLPIN